LEILADAIGVEATRVHTTDRLDEDLGFMGMRLGEAEIWDDVYGALSHWVNRTSGRRFEDGPSWRTIDDVIRGTISQISPTN
jgi:hypothetical protein